MSVTEAAGSPVGVDLGVKHMAVCSDGRRFDNPKPLKRAQRRLKCAQRVLSRRKKGSANREKARQRLAKLHYRIANIRKDALHKATSAIVARTKPDDERPIVVVIEDLNVRGMASNHCLAQAILDVGFYEFRRQLEYKTRWAGEKLLVADRFFPSSRLCSACGRKNTKLTLKDRTWVCECGAVHDRDLNAATNLKQLATPISGGSDACGESVRPEGHVALTAVSSKQEPTKGRKSL
jgi:putative transposase